MGERFRAPIDRARSVHTPRKPVAVKNDADKDGRRARSDRDPEPAAGVPNEKSIQVRNPFLPGDKCLPLPFRAAALVSTYPSNLAASGSEGADRILRV